MKTYLSLLLIFIFSISLQNCSFKDDKVNPNPCLKAKPVTAEFKIYETIGDSLTETDTSFVGVPIVFKTIGDYDEFTLTVGQHNKVFNDKQVVLRFLDPITITVQLIVKSSPNKICFPTDDGKDTLTKTLTILPKRDYYDFAKSAICGNYLGYLQEKPAETFIVKLYYDALAPMRPDKNRGGFIISNINKGCNLMLNDASFLLGEVGYKSISFGESTTFDYGCNGVIAFGKLQPDRNHIIIYYSDADFANYRLRKNHVFIGKRMQ